MLPHKKILIWSGHVQCHHKLINMIRLQHQHAAICSWTILLSFLFLLVSGRLDAVNVSCCLQQVINRGLDRFLLNETPYNYKYRHIHYSVNWANTNSSIGHVVLVSLQHVPRKSGKLIKKDLSNKSNAIIHGAADQQLHVFNVLVNHYTSGEYGILM